MNFLTNITNKIMGKNDSGVDEKDLHHQYKASLKTHNDLVLEYSKVKVPKGQEPSPRQLEIEKIFQDEENTRNELRKKINA